VSKPLIIIHPRKSFIEDIGCAYPEMITLGEEQVEQACLNLDPAFFDLKDETPTINTNFGWIAAVMLKGSQIISDDMAQQRFMKRRAVEKIVKAVETGLEKANGEHLVVSLGALTSPITNQGMDLVPLFNGKPVTFTTGNSLTAYVTIKAVESIYQQKRKTDISNENVAVLGATGSVGSAVSEYFAARGCNMLLCARNQPKLEVLKEKIMKARIPGRGSIQTTTDIKRMSESGVVIVTTASNSVLIKPEMCAPEAIIYDDTVPRNTCETITSKRPDVTIIDGGIIEMPHIDYGVVTMGLPGRRTYACQIEAMILAKEDIKTNFLGNVTLEQVRSIGLLFEKLQSEFFIAPFTSFGKSIDI